mmetsp:Transcript_22170/g.36456  ORF Transcript_22170/g.36456 Transcript_22170/m.36456 type:complete len:517 (+) Transcript_22170:21-1571(+)
MATHANMRVNSSIVICRRRLMTTKSRQLMHGPGGFRQASGEGSSMVENRPYFPELIVDLHDESTVIDAANVILSCVGGIKAGTIDTRSDIRNTTTAKVSIVSGGLTNALFRVDINDEEKQPSSVLVRIFGAEGMIDRDTETANFARLCDSKGSAVHSQLDYLGRFGNGRIETLIPNMRAATICDFKENEELVLEVIRQMARLHYGFDIPEYLIDRDSISSCGGDGGGEGESDCRQLQPVLWDVLASWNNELVTKISQACSRDLRLVVIFCSALFGDTHIVAEDGDGINESALTEMMAQIAQILNRETQWIQDHVIEHHPDAPIAFCHNDINAANILINVGLDSGDGNGCDRDSVAMIDYEYGALNYTQYDIANFICEHCGGNDNGIPDYNLMPTLELQRKLVHEYIQERDRVLNNSKRHVDEQKEVAKLLSQVQTFQMVSHLYWGTWGILQGVTELLEGRYEIDKVKSRLYNKMDVDSWDNLRYGKSRLNQYRKHKQSILETGQKQMSYLYHSGRL